MKLYFHFCKQGFSNCYILGDETNKETPLRNDAILIDPGNMDAGLLRLIEDNHYDLKGVLITHDHPHHVRGLKTIMRIYDVEVFAINPTIGEYQTTIVKDGEKVNVGPFTVEVFSIPGHSSDSAVYLIKRLLFTGDTLSAGLMGTTASSYAEANLAGELRKKILSLPGDYTILPGHGPPSSLEAERRFNLDLYYFEQQKNRRPTLRLEF